ncbi:MAG TPA: protein kinase [Gemmata sp.]|nr:protein kinase [Gemmata sp.]
MTEETIFTFALDKTDPAERDGFLTEACGEDIELRKRVETLLTAYEKAGIFLERAAVASADDPEPGETRAFIETPDAEARLTRTHDGSSTSASDAVEIRAFLKPSTRPDSLGRLAHYEILQIIGQGGFGTVMKAFDERLHRIVAIKVMAPQLATSGAARARFLREARAAAVVMNENVVGIHAVSSDDEPIPYLVMEFVPGQTLQDKLDKVGPLSATEVLRIGLQIARGLSAAHVQGLIHRDIKPANILLENGVERVKITDFGLARAADDASISHSGVVAGTPMYMAPEQAQGEQIDHRADLFSLGSVLYAMCTGHPPFRASTTMAVLKRVVEETPRPIREINSGIPPWLVEVVTKLHAKEPRERFFSAKEVADLLANYLTELQLHGTVVVPASNRPASDRSSKDKLLQSCSSGCVIILTALCLIIAVIYLSTEKHPFGLFKPIGRVELECKGPGYYVRILNISTKKSVESKISGEPATFELPPDWYTVTVWKGAEVVYEETFHLPNNELKKIIVPLLGDVRFEVLDPEISIVVDDEILMTKRERDVNVFFKQHLPVGNHQWKAIKNSKVVASDEFQLHSDEAFSKRIDSKTLASHSWLKLFNGKDLTGWMVSSYLPNNWRVVDGVLVGRDLNTRLFTERGDYKNFHFKTEVRINEKGSCGLWFRSPTVEDMVGYAVRLDGPESKPANASSLLRYGGASAKGWGGNTRPPIPVNKWFVLELIAQGSSLTVKIDGVIMQVVNDSGYARGHIGLQSSYQSGVTEFRGVEVMELPPFPPVTVAVSPSSNHAIEFDGRSSHVEIPSLSTDGTHPLTVECYCQPRRISDKGDCILAMSGKGALFVNIGGDPSYLTSGVFLGNEPYGQHFLLPENFPQKFHLATVWDGKEYRLYVDGRRVGQPYETGLRANMNQGTFLGATPGGDAKRRFDGILGEVRISKVARYDKDFTPQKRFATDNDTLALYHFDEGQGEALKDSSGNGHHGKIVSAKWVNGGPATPEVSPK